MSLALETLGGNVLRVQVSGKISKEDYEKFVPEVERLIAKTGKIRILLEMQDFHGWSMSAVWEDIKFDMKHFSHIERLAMVGDKQWEGWMAKFCKPFTSAAIRYFDVSQAQEAKTWIEAN